MIGLHPDRPDLAAATRAALAEQVPVPAEAADLAAAQASESGWIWLLDGVTVPEPGALAALADAARSLDGLSQPVVLASRVLDEDRAMHPDALPRHELFEKRLSVDAAARGLVQLRAVPAGSVLVSAAVLERFDPPRADLPPRWSVLEFTLRVLRSWEDTGFLVPESVAVRRLAPRPTGRAGGALRSRARLLGSPGWTTPERLLELYTLAGSTASGSAA